MKQKPVLRFPGTSYLIDGPYINVGSVVALTILSFFFFMSIALVLSWHDFPLLPLPTNNRVPLYHLVAFYKVWAGKFIPFFQGETYQQYTAWILWLGDRGELGRLGWRWTFSFLIGAVAAVKIAFAAWKPVTTEIQTRGRVLVEGEDAYPTLKADFANQVRREAENKVNGEAAPIPPAFTWETDEGYIPTDPDNNQLKPSQKVVMPDAQRRSHFFFAAGTRRGKTQLILKRIIEFMLRILKGEAIKVMIIDTAKADYSRYIPRKLMHMIAPQEKSGEAWDVANDLQVKAHAEEFWKGQIPDSEKDPFWNNAARSLGAASTVALINTSGNDWSLNNVTYYLKLSPKEYEPIVRQHYPEALQIIQMGDTTLSSVMGTLESFTKHILQLAEVWDGYQYKHDIKQMSVRLLQDKYESNQYLFAESLMPVFDDQSKIILENLLPNMILRGLLKTFNEEIGNEEGNRWRWKQMADTLRKPYREILKIAFKHYTAEEKSIFVNPAVKGAVVKAAFEFREKNLQLFTKDSEMTSYVDAHFSKPEDKQANLVFKAVLRKFRETHELIIGIVDTFENWDNSIFDFLLENLSSKELSRLMTDNDHEKLIRAAKPIFTYHHIWDKFETQPRFSFRDWIYNENPEKKFLVLKTSGQFSALTNPLVRGMLFYAKGLIDDDGFLDDKDAGMIRKFYILMDEFQALGNIKEFIEGALERFASKGVTVMLAVQDLAQLVKIYGQEFVDFLMSNTGNIFFIGSNIGKTSEMISNAVGKKWFKKLHASVTYQENGKSFSQNWQEHEGVVITPDEVNSKLGLDANGYPKRTFMEWLLRLDPKKLPIRYLYIGANMPKAYLLETPVCGYKQENRPEAADWRDPNKKPELNDFEGEVADILANGGKHDIERKIKPSNQWISNEQPILTFNDPDDQDIAAWMSQGVEDYTAEPEPYSEAQSQQMLERLKKQAESSPIYIVPSEDESLAGEVGKSVAFEALVDSHALSAVKETAEALLGSTQRKTNNKEEFKKALERKRENLKDS
ncbi:type IV secretion system DNA-binding domain-containing protein [Burkholderia multivorans]|uniref:type IV secretion system DNA-binding domain-containing protein n=1 Tax=Burkholderia multivorans TaxID=87883 RepID=UPI001C219143|nr:type IV secretion system DNA-binding domain-containing protein [Burkholderia multivorans]MBU9118430.1 type IV secretion system DNA-binding domain-containing protein [Burkholderia multivorans]